MVLENVLMFPKVDKPNQTKLKRLKVEGERNFLMAITKRPVIVFKDLAEADSHYAMLMRVIGKQVELDMHKKYESTKEYQPMFKVKLQIKEGVEINNEQIGEQVRKAVESTIGPLTEEELNSQAYYFDTSIYNNKNASINNESIKTSTLVALQATGAYPTGIGELNDNLVAIFLRSGVYHKFEFMTFFIKSVDIFDSIVDLNVHINGVEKSLTWKEFVELAIASKNALNDA